MRTLAHGVGKSFAKEMLLQGSLARMLARNHANDQGEHDREIDELGDAGARRTTPSTTSAKFRPGIANTGSISILPYHLCKNFHGFFQLHIGAAGMFRPPFVEDFGAGGIRNPVAGRPLSLLKTGDGVGCGLVINPGDGSRP